MGKILDQSLLVILAVIILGAFCYRKQILNQIQIDGFEVFLFRLGMPAFLFTATYRHDLQVLFNPGFIYCYLLAFLVISILAFYCFKKDNAKDEVFMKIFASAYVNSAIYALPIIVILFKDPTAGVLANILQIVVIQSIFIAIFSFIKNRSKTVFKRFFTVISTPIIIMPVLGLLFNATRVQMPAILTAVIQNIGNTAPTIALFTFGATLGSTKINRALITQEMRTLLILKNVLHPFVTFCLGNYVFQLKGYWLLTLVIATSAPSAFLVTIVAKQFNIVPDLMKRTVALSSLLSLITLFFIISIFQATI